MWEGPMKPNAREIIKTALFKLKNERVQILETENFMWWLVLTTKKKLMKRIPRLNGKNKRCKWSNNGYIGWARVEWVYYWSLKWNEYVSWRGGEVDEVFYCRVQLDFSMDRDISTDWNRPVENLRLLQDMRNWVSVELLKNEGWKKNVI